VKGICRVHFYTYSIMTHTFSSSSSNCLNVATRKL